MAEWRIPIEHLLVFAGEEEAKHYRSPERTEADRNNIRAELETAYLSIPDPAEAELKQFVGENTWRETEHNPSARELPKAQWKGFRKAEAREKLAKIKNEGPFDLSTFDPSALDLSFLHHAERDRILRREFYPQEVALLLDRKNPWTESGKPKPLPPQRPLDSKPEEPRGVSVPEQRRHNLPFDYKEREEEVGTRLPSHGAGPSTEKEKRFDALQQFMPKPLRDEYEKADAKRKEALWAANEANYDAAQKRAEQQLLREKEHTQKVFDLLHQLREDPSNAHLLPPDDASMADLEKWYEEMQKPVRIVPFPGEGGYRDDHPMAGVIRSLRAGKARHNESDGVSVPEQRRNSLPWEIGELLRFMPKPLRDEYDRADAERKQAILETAKQLYEADERERKQRIEQEQERNKKTLDLYRRIKNDPSKAHLLPPEGSSMDELYKWHDEMRKPVNRPLYGEKARPGTRPDPRASGKPVRPSHPVVAQPSPPPSDQYNGDNSSKRHPLLAALFAVFGTLILNELHVPPKITIPLWVVLGLCIWQWPRIVKSKRRLVFFWTSLAFCLLALVGYVLAFQVNQPSPASLSVPSPLPATEERKTTGESREFANVDAGYLVGLYQKYSSAQADEAVKTYIGKWIKVSGQVADVNREKHRDEPDSVNISVAVDKPDGWIWYAAVVNFDEQRWKDRALVFQKDEKVTVIGRIAKVSGAGIVLDKGEITE